MIARRARLAAAAGMPAGYATIIAVLSLVTVLYTYVGGIRAVVWTDAIQTSPYIGGAVVRAVVLLEQVGRAGVSHAFATGRFVVRHYTLAFTCYVPPGVAVTLVVGGLLSLTDLPPVPGDAAAVRPMPT